MESKKKVLVVSKEIGAGKAFLAQHLASGNPDAIVISTDEPQIYDLKSSPFGPEPFKIKARSAAADFVASTIYSSKKKRGSNFTPKKKKRK